MKSAISAKSLGYRCPRGDEDLLPGSEAQHFSRLSAARICIWRFVLAKGSPGAGLQAKMHDLQLPILTSILPSNEMQIARGLQLIMEKGHKRVGVFGLQFQSRNGRSCGRAR